MAVSLAMIASITSEADLSFTKATQVQLQWFILGWIVYFFFAGLDYRQFLSWSKVGYLFILLLLVGLFFTSPIQNVYRWYRLPFIGREVQPSEYAKLIVIIALSCFIEKRKYRISSWSTAFLAILIFFAPFILILKQPDLGTALVLYPVTWTLFYMGNIRKSVVKIMALLVVLFSLFTGLIFTGILSHEQCRSFVTHFLKSYQYDRLNPETYHHRAAQIAIGLGGMRGSGWHKGDFSTQGWLPAAYTDSIFAAYSEEFGLLGIFFLLFLFFGLIYFCFQVTAKAKDRLGQLLSAGIATCLAIHIIVNIGMMSGLFPITGVPLLLITYGGSSVVSTMMALGIVQNIYVQRFVF